MSQTRRKRKKSPPIVTGSGLLMASPKGFWKRKNWATLVLRRSQNFMLLCQRLQTSTKEEERRLLARHRVEGILPRQDSHDIGDRGASELVARLDRVPCGVGCDDDILQLEKFLRNLRFILQNVFLARNELVAPGFG